jgi:hypothetical protein
MRSAVWTDEDWCGRRWWSKALEGAGAERGGDEPCLYGVLVCEEEEEEEQPSLCLPNDESRAGGWTASSHAEDSISRFIVATKSFVEGFRARCRRERSERCDDRDAGSSFCGFGTDSTNEAGDKADTKENCAGRGSSQRAAPLVFL